MCFVTRTVNIIIAFTSINKGCFYPWIGISLIDLQFQQGYSDAILRYGKTLPVSGDNLG
jgi:hypothetical protein